MSSQKVLSLLFLYIPRNLTLQNKVKEVKKIEESVCDFVGPNELVQIIVTYLLSEFHCICNYLAELNFQKIANTFHRRILQEAFINSITPVYMYTWQFGCPTTVFTFHEIHQKIRKHGVLHNLPPITLPFFFLESSVSDIQGIAHVYRIKVNELTSLHLLIAAANIRSTAWFSYTPRYFALCLFKCWTELEHHLLPSHPWESILKALVDLFRCATLNRFLSSTMLLQTLIIITLFQKSTNLSDQHDSFDSLFSYRSSLIFVFNVSKERFLYHGLQ